jgi:uncharacterized Zn finger protein (UPF0148 family)
MEVPRIWDCSCGSSNFKINKDTATLICAHCEQAQSETWQVRVIDQQAEVNCNCGSPIFSIVHPGILFCPNCKKDASGSWQLVSAQQQQMVQINPVQHVKQ